MAGAPAIISGCREVVVRVILPFETYERIRDLARRRHGETVDEWLLFFAIPEGLSEEEAREALERDCAPQEGEPRVSPELPDAPDPDIEEIERLTDPDLGEISRIVEPDLAPSRRVEPDIPSTAGHQDRYSTGRVLTQSCGWCDEMVAIEIRYCPNCGHNPHVARAACDCDRCVGQRLGIPWSPEPPITQEDVKELARWLDCRD